MRHKHEKLWSTRTVTRFLWFPKTLEGETRWLERATWTQKLYCDTCTDWCTCLLKYWMGESWCDTRQNDTEELGVASRDSAE